MTGPVYFISHGGPPTLFDLESAPHQAWKSVGKHILDDIKTGVIHKDKGLICVSAHWENEETDAGVLVNIDQTNPLIYDFYNFPAHYYEQRFESSHTAANVKDVKLALVAAGVDVAERRRGLDHGLWVPFKIFFPRGSPVPVLQISLPALPQDSQRPAHLDLRYAEESVRLGRALYGLREMGYGIMATGQPVHDLRAFRSAMAISNKDLFNNFFAAMQSAALTPAPTSSVVSLFSRDDYRTSHPTAEHLVPLAVAASAAEGGLKPGKGAEELFAMGDGPLGWWMGRWE